VEQGWQSLPQVLRTSQMPGTCTSGAGHNSVRAPSQPFTNCEKVILRVVTEL
jgi:hypothetical protein